MRSNRSARPSLEYIYNLIQESVLAFDIEFNGKSTFHTNSIRRHHTTPKRNMGMLKVRRTKQGYTSLPESLLKSMGSPLHFPTLPPSLTFTPNENFELIPYRIQMEAKWVDRRGMISCLGSNFRKWVASQGPRRTITCRGYRHTLEESKIPEYSINYVPGKTVSKAGNFFLYSQNLNIYNPYTKEYETVLWVGLASCMSIQYLYTHPYATKIMKSLLEAKKLKKTITPLSRYNAKTPEGIRWSAATWEKIAGQTLDQHQKQSHPKILETLILVEELFSTPEGIKLQRMEDLAQIKKQELDELEAQLEITEKQLLKTQTAIITELQRVREYQLSLQRNREKIPSLVKEKEKLHPEVSARKAIFSKIQTAIEKKRTAFELNKRNFLRADKFKNSSSYAEGLAKSGLVIDDLVYKNQVSGRMKTASDNPDITVQRDWKLIKAYMHTTRPIKMHFGLENEKPRASGPHRLKVWLEEGTPKLKISPLVAWAALGWDETTFKITPHADSCSIDTTQPAMSICNDILDHSPTVCMGELSATASWAFHDNNPKMLALAILSFLQSVNKKDIWGKTYTTFPFWEDVQKSKLPNDYTHWVENTVIKQSEAPKYYISKCSNYFFEVTKGSDGCDCRWGRLRKTDNGLVETSNNSHLNYIRSDYNTTYTLLCANAQWVLSPFAAIQQKHDGTTPGWNPMSYVPPPTDSLATPTS